MSYSRNLLLVAALAGVIAATTGSASAQQYWKYQDGAVSIRFETDTLKLAGVTISDLSGLDAASSLGQASPTWKLDQTGTTMGVVTSRSLFDRYEYGELQVRGGFALSYKGRTIDFRGFRLIPTKETGSATFRLLADAGSQAALPLELNALRPVVQFDPNGRTLDQTGFALNISPALAEQLGAPQLAGMNVGLMNVHGAMRLASGPSWDPFVETPDNSGGHHRTSALDIGICQLSSLSQYGREQIGGIWYNGFGALTTSINLGTGAITWRATGTGIGVTMNIDHPTIGVNMFRVSNGRFEQIGEGWLKHGFSATNSTECPTTCTPSGSGSSLGEGCTDTYGSGLNAGQDYLGPKSEVNPYTGQWTAEGSWFSQGANDRIRRINTSQRRDPVTGVTSPYTFTATQNRMKVTDDDLSVAGAQYYYEGFYMAGWVHSNNTSSGAILAQVDVNKYNNIAYRRTTPTWNGTSWNTSDSSTLSMGPAINSWGDSRYTLQPRLVGDVITAVKTTPIGSGWYFYDYVVYNLDLDRQVKSFYVSVADNVNLRNLTFRDIDQNAGNEWTITRSNGNVRWEMQPSQVNPLMYGRAFNFRFEAQQAPVPSFAQAGMIKTGTFPWLSTIMTGPTPSTRPLNGTLTIPGRQAVAPTNVNVRFTPVDSGGIVNANGVSVNMPSGAYSALISARGRYNVSIAGAPFLRKNFPTVVNMGPDGGDIPVNLTLIPGDVNGSNEIDAADIDAVIAQFGFIGSSPADVDGSGEVDAADIDLVISNFGAVGDA